MRPVIVICFFLAMLTGCSKRASTGAGQTATIALTDGTTVNGMVTKSDTSSITIQTPSGVVSTYPLSQVSSVNYASAASAPAPAAPESGAPPQSAPAPGPANASAVPPPPGSLPLESPAPGATPGPPPDRNYVAAETFRTIPEGRTIPVRTDQTIDSDTAEPGQTFSGVVAHDVLDGDGQVAIPRGSRATLVVRDARAQGKVQGRSELVLDVAAVQVGERQYRLETTDFVEKGREGIGANSRTAKFTGGGTLLGGIIGAVAGGGKGAAIGAMSGAAAGAGTQSLTRGKGVRIAAETVLNFRLVAPIRIREMR